MMVLSASKATRAPRKTPGVLAAALAPVMTRAEIDAELDGAALQEALQRAIAMHRYSCTWTKVPAGWVVALSFPEPRRFFGTTLEEALAWCLDWVRTREIELPSRADSVGTAAT